MSYSTFEEVQTKVEEWAMARKIIPYAKPHTQLMKAVSELGELCDAELKGDRAKMVDGVGDVLVCLINYCALHHICLVGSLMVAYDEIKDRKGTTLPDGTFVKET